MKCKALKGTVINGAVVWAGEEVDADPETVYKLERRDEVERAVSEWEKIEADIMKREELPPLRDILVFTPVYRLEPETILALMNLEFEGALTFCLQRDNPIREDGTPTVESGMAPLPRYILRRREGIVGRMNHLHQYQRGRKLFLRGPYDAMLVIESDIVCPPDTLTRLARLNAEVAYGVYRFRGGDVINIFERYPDKNGEPARNVGESLTFRKHAFRRAVVRGQYPCSGGGLGVALIRRNVLEQIDFRKEDPEGPHCDTYFTRDAFQHGYSMWADMDLVCGHKNEHGEILWPGYPGGVRSDAQILGGKHMTGKGRVLRAFAGRDGNGVKVAYREGDLVTVPENTDWAKAGLVEMIGVAQDGQDRQDGAQIASQSLAMTEGGVYAG